jgi:hypothetical protein
MQSVVWKKILVLHLFLSSVPYTALCLMYFTWKLCHFHQPPWECDSSHVVKKFPAFYEAWRYTTTFTTACHWTLSWATTQTLCFF